VLDSLFNLKDGGGTFAQNVSELLPDDTVFISQKTVLFIVTAVRTLNPVYLLSSEETVF
jgi:hypothetical protein